MSESNVTAPGGGDAQKARNLLLITYILFGVGLVVGISAIAGIIIAHLKSGDVDSEFLKSHYRWLIRSFWYGLLGAIVGYLTIPLIIGMIILPVVWLWYLYRLVKGFLRFSDDKPIEDPAAWL